MSIRYSYHTRLIVAICVALITVVTLACGGGGIASLEDERGEHAATLLMDGRLFVAGGRDSKAIASAEVYDPTIGEWSSAGRLTVARYGHTQTLLKDGKVLVIGGNATPEVYDPATGTWSSAGNMSFLRISGHATTLLEDGRVLVTGGISEVTGSRKKVAFAELYDPSTGTWELTGDMTEPRERHRAILLTDTTVLVVGSDTSVAYRIGSTTAELYDPATGKWSKAGNLPNDHAERFTLTLLGDGKVLVAGGGTRGRTLAPNITASMDIYDQSTGEWSTTMDMTAKSWGHTATTLSDGKILFVGMVTVQIFDPAAESWTFVGKLTEARNGVHTATLLEDGRVLIVGGDDITLDRFGRIGGREGLASVRVYDQTEEW